MKLDVANMRFLSKDDFRVLMAVEMGMRNHEWVPVPLISSIAGLKRGGAFRFLSVLHKHKLVVHDGKRYDGYKLTYLGYDYLALRTLRERGVIASVGNEIGVGKESDVYVAETPAGERVALKLHRLGRTSFRAVRSKRDYHRHRNGVSFLYLSRLAAQREFSFMSALAEHGFPVPRPIDNNRHVVVMELIEGASLASITEMGEPHRCYADAMELLMRLGLHGLVHCDFNEFNLLIEPDYTLRLIDFPQMISSAHPNAEEWFSADVECVRTYFRRRFHFESDDFPVFEDVRDARVASLDAALEASGFSREGESELLSYLRRSDDGTGDEEEEGDGGDGDGDGDENEEEEEEEEEEKRQEENVEMKAAVESNEEEDEDEDEDEYEDEDESDDDGGEDDVDVGGSGSGHLGGDGEDGIAVERKALDVKDRVRKQFDSARARQALKERCKHKNSTKNRARFRGNKAKMQ
jgi:RIO kinase 2